ncbi:MAG: hypothetical protein ACOYXR_14685 [Nitrospirota bacterium]
MFTCKGLMYRIPGWVAMGLLGGILLSCGDNNLLSGFADEESAEAKLAVAQSALDSGDCGTAVTLFEELQTADPTNVARRLDLSAAYLCAAGFDVTEFISVAAMFGSGDVTSNQVFEQIADAALTSMSTTWPAEIASAETLLAADLSASPPLAYNDDDDAAFILALVEMVKAVLTVSDILNYVNGVVDCAATQGAIAGCDISTTNVSDIVDALNNASGVLGGLGVSSEVQDSINTILFDINNEDGDAGNAVTCDDLQGYLTRQGFDLTGVNCVV